MTFLLLAIAIAWFLAICGGLAAPPAALLRIILWPLYLAFVWLPHLIRWLSVRVFCLVRDWVRRFGGEMFRAWLGPVKREKS